MKSFVFETENHNAYLYSPKVKKFIPIPLSTKKAYRVANTPKMIM